MRVGIDGYPLSEPLTGVGHYTLELARALARNFAADQFELVSPRPCEPSVIDQLAAALPNLKLVAARSSSIRGHWWSVGLPLYARRARLDLFHGTNFEVPLWQKKRTVLTIHDLSTLLYPETHRPRAARRARLRLPLAVKLARAIITPTQTIKREVCNHFRVTKDRVTAIYEAPRRTFQLVARAEAETVKKRLGVRDEFVLFVGTLEPRKNLLTLLKAWTKVRPSSTPDLQLVIAGGEGWLMEQTLAHLESAADRDRILLTGYLDDHELASLYSSCRLFVYPSLYEGFGLPPLEAMACGAPVIAARIGALQETLSDAAVLFDPLDEQSLGTAMLDVLHDQSLRAGMSAKGLAQAAGFTWDQTAKLTHEVYERVLAP